MKSLCGPTLPHHPSRGSLRSSHQFNLSETVFITRAPAGAPGYSLAYFTPTTEINLCGHATLAAASVLFAHPSVDSPTLDFVTRSGINLKATTNPNNEVQLDFPENPPSEVTEERLVGLVEVRAGGGGGKSRQQARQAILI